MDELELADRWEFMRPWCAPLRGRLVLSQSPRRSVPNAERVGVVVHLPETEEGATSKKLRSIRDALVLLAMVADASFSAFKHVLFTHCALSRENREELLESGALRRPRFLLHISERGLNDHNGWVADTLVRFFSELEAPPNAHLLALAKRRVVVRGDRGHQQPLLARLDIPLAISIAIEVDTPFLGRVWRAIKSLHAKHGSWRFPVGDSPALVSVDARHVQQDCGFVLEAIDISTFEGDLSPETARCFEEIVTGSEGLTASPLRLTADIDSDSIEDDARRLQAVGSLVERLLCSEQARGVVNEIQLVCNQDVMADFARLCSAIAETKSATELSLRLDFIFDIEADERAHMWECLAYALFSGHARARSTITSIHIQEAYVSVADADAVAAVLASPDSIAYLLNLRTSGNGGENNSGGRRRRDRALRVWKLKQGTRLTLQQMEDDDELLEESASWELATDVRGVKLLHHRDGQQPARVLVPGYGACTVNHDQLILVEDAEHEGGITSLQVECSQESEAATGLWQLIGLIGSSLTCLALGLSPGTQLQTASILASCPKLKTLSVGHGPINTESFLAAYRNSDVCIDELDCSFDNVRLLTEELSDKSTRLAKTLKRLAYRVQQNAVWDHWTDDPFECMMSILGSNRSLEYLQLSVPDEMFENAPLKDLQRYHSQVLPVVHERLPLECRVAFLSIFSPGDHTGGERDAKLRQLRLSSVLAEFPMERNVLSLIFDFAATNVRRRVYVTPYW